MLLPPESFRLRQAVTICCGDNANNGEKLIRLECDRGSRARKEAGRGTIKAKDKSWHI